MDIRPFTDDEAKNLPIVHLTRDIPWDPSRYDSTSLSDRMDAHDAYTCVDEVDDKQYIRYGLDMEEEDSDYEYEYSYTYKEDMDNGRRPDAEFVNTLIG